MPPYVQANKGRAANVGCIDSVPLTLSCAFFSLSEYGTARINIVPLATAWILGGCVLTDGQVAKQWAVATAT